MGLFDDNTPPSGATLRNVVADADTSGAGAGGLSCGEVLVTMFFVVAAVAGLVALILGVMGAL